MLKNKMQSYMMEQKRLSKRSSKGQRSNIRFCLKEFAERYLRLSWHHQPFLDKNQVTV
jgi:hypothetical protein